MSRAFVKDSDDAGDALPDIPLSEHPNYVTPHGLARLRERLDAAQVRRDQLKAGDTELAQQGELAALERELRWLKARVASAIEIDLSQQPRDRVAFGARVTVDAENDGERTYRIVGEDEADAEHGLVSYVSPLARALIGARIGNEVTWQRPAGDLKLEIVAIDYGDDT